jgi:hypothetical protein
MTPVMNLLNKSTAKFDVSVIVLILMMMITDRSHAQKQYTSILKNINPEAQNLYHDVSPKGDTLYLKAASIFYKVTFLNSLDRKVYTFNPPVLEGKIPLHDIIVGDYTVLVYKKDRIIVFHISRLEEIEKPSEMIASNDVFFSQEIAIVKPVHTKVQPKEKPAPKPVMNEIKIDDTLELSIEELKVAVTDDYLNINESMLQTKTRAYNLSSLYRTNMQSREEYRRNNLRPNGKPY